MIVQPSMPMPAQPAPAPARELAQVVVRPATRKDRGAIRRMECACFGRSRLFFGLWPRAGRRDTRTWLALVDGRPAGYLIAFSRPMGAQKRLYIGGVGVLPAHRRHGIGAKLTLEALLADPATWLHVRGSNETAIRLYERLGMRAVNRITRFYGNGEDALVMSRVGEMR
jgi:ribosomal-protein-alanine N-acetyltransferase